LTVWVALALWLLLLLLLWWLGVSVARVLLLLLLPVCRSAPGTPVAPVALPPRGLLLIASSIVSVLLSTVASLLLAVLLLLTWLCPAVRSGAPRPVGYGFSIGSDAR
jgi:hypothetical protein